jgi:hypothetical protein
MNISGFTKLRCGRSLRVLAAFLGVTAIVTATAARASVRRRAFSFIALTTSALVISSGLAIVPAATASAAGAPAAPFTQCPAVGADPSCEILLVVNPGNTVSVYGDPSVGPFDGSDDTLVGIVNDSSAAVKAVTVSGPGSGLSGFDGDGICSGDYGTWNGSSSCPYGPTGYEGPGTSFVTSPSLPDSAEVDFTGGLAPGKSAYFSLEGALTSAQLTAREGSLGKHYDLDLKLWIPQKAVVDPANPLGSMTYGAWQLLARAGLEPDLTNPSPAVGLFEAGSTCQDPTTTLGRLLTSVSSTLDGDGYAGYDDGTSYRVAAKLSFDWDGSGVSNLVFTPEAGFSHRTIIEKTVTTHGIVTRRCIEDHPDTVMGSATASSPSTIAIKLSGIVGFLTPLVHLSGAYPATSWNVAIKPDGSLGISYNVSEFPSTGLKVLVNDQVEGTDIVNDASCYKQWEVVGPWGATGLFLLFHRTTSGSLPAITPAGSPVNVDIRSPGC